MTSPLASSYCPPVLPTHDAPRPADYAALSEAESRIRAQEIHRRRREAVSEAMSIVAGVRVEVVR